jgi:hypothetical protein
VSDHPILPYAETPPPPPPPPLPTTGAVPAPLGSDDPNYHCPNCLFIPMPSEASGGFWACQNLCERD